LIPISKSTTAFHEILVTLDDENYAKSWLD